MSVKACRQELPNIGVKLTALRAAAYARTLANRQDLPGMTQTEQGYSIYEQIFERLLELRNDVGLLAEEWDPATRRQLGNYPQAFTHVSLVNTAFNLDREYVGTPMEQRTPVEGPVGY